MDDPGAATDDSEGAASGTPVAAPLDPAEPGAQHPGARQDEPAAQDGSGHAPAATAAPTALPAAAPASTDVSGIDAASVAKATPADEAATAAPAAPPAPRFTGHSGPSFARARAPIGTRRIRWPEVAVAAALALLLLLQLLLAQREALASQAQWRPWIASACGLLGCDIRPWRDPQAFSMLQRDVRPAPAREGVLVVDASFRNDAPWPQAWPNLLLTLSDVDGLPVGARAFTPAQYRGAEADASLLASGQSASVRFEVVEPAPRIVAFAFEFR
ncbi:MAG: DUF3426 domain-containing protein [Pseudomonadota bacterium]|nr:DUF3426 domain-containing protein [Pseudomonadota bacterium]